MKKIKVEVHHHGGWSVIFIIITNIYFFIIIETRKRNDSGKRDISSYWGLWEEKEMMDPVIKLYEQKNPGVKIIYEKKHHRTIVKIDSPESKGQGPDIFRFHNTWLPQMKGNYCPLPPEV